MCAHHKKKINSDLKLVTYKCAHQLITLFSINLNTTFRFISRNEFSMIEVASKMQNGHMAIQSIIISQTAEIHGACGKPFRPSLTTSPRHRPATMTHPSQMHSTTFIHGLKCRTTHLHKNCPHIPTTRHSVCLQLT